MQKSFLFYHDFNKQEFDPSKFFHLQLLLPAPENGDILKFAHLKLTHGLRSCHGLCGITTSSLIAIIAKSKVGMIQLSVDEMHF